MWLKKKKKLQTQISFQISPLDKAVCVWNTLNQIVNTDCCQFFTLALSLFLLHISCIICPFEKLPPSSCTSMKCLLVIFYTALIIFILSLLLCVSLRPKRTELSGSKAQQARREQNGVEKRGGASLAGQLRPRAAEVNVDFYT